MRTPVEVVKGRIINYNPETGTMTIQATYPDWQMYVKRGYKACRIQLVDSRTISDRQRRSIYAMLGEIADYTGMDLEMTKETMKDHYLEELRAENPKAELEGFSLSNCPVSLASDFQRHLVRFIVDFDVPCRVPLIRYVDDTGDYLYACLMQRKCCVCGRHADLHHVDAVGMGNDRKRIVHEGLRVLPLCREHHTEAHEIGLHEFSERYHIDRTIALDKFLCQLYNLNTKEDN